MQIFVWDVSVQLAVGVSDWRFLKKRYLSVMIEGLSDVRKYQKGMIRRKDTDFQ